MVVHSLTFLSTMGRCLLVRDDLTWCHWSKYEFLALHLEAIVIGSSVVDDAAVELVIGSSVVDDVTVELPRSSR